MKRIALPFLVLMFMTGVGLGSYGYIGQAEASGGKKKAEATEGGVPAITYVAMDPLILPIIDREGISQTISIVISLQVGDPGKAEEVRHNLPKLADAYLSDMYGALSKTASMEGGVIKVSMLKNRLKDVTKKLVPEGGIDDVLLQVLQQHPV